MLETVQALTLRKTEEADLDYVLDAEHGDENRSFLIPWSREQHVQSLANPDIQHLIAQTEIRVGYAILAGFRGSHQSIELRRLVITAKGRGYGKASVELIKDLAFKTHGAHRLWLDVKDHNQRARGLYEAAGFVVEGTLRECLKTERGFESLIVMSILRPEWEKSGI